MRDAGYLGYLTLPLSNEQVHQSLCLVSHASEDTSEVITRFTADDHLKNTHNILIVDDNSTNRKVATKNGFQVDAAPSGQEALEAVTVKTYHMIFMDIRMPEMDGIQCTKHLRELEAYRKTPIIALTADVVDGAQEKYLNLGMDDFVAKPFKKETIISMAEKWIFNEST